jgi:hypothetical protein
VLESFTSAGAEILNPTQPGVDGLARPAEQWRSPENTLALIEIPTNFQAIKQRDMGLAQAWRSQTRSMFREAFGTGYWVTDFFHEPVDGRQRSFYALSRAELRVGSAKAKHEDRRSSHSFHVKLPYLALPDLALGGKRSRMFAGAAAWRAGSPLGANAWLAFEPGYSTKPPRPTGTSWRDFIIPVLAASLDDVGLSRRGWSR